MAIGTGYGLYLRAPHSERADLLYYTVRPETLNLTVVERGTLESADNRDVICRVRAGNKASNLTIKWVIEDGAVVKQGQLLVEIEDTALQDQLKTQRIALDTAWSAMVQAEEELKIVLSQNHSDIATAEIAVELAEIDLKKYLEGDYLQSKRDVENRILLAKSDVELQADRVAYAERMVKLRYLSAAQLQSEQSKLRSLEVAQEKVIEERRVLDDYTKNRTVKDLTNKVEEAKRSLETKKSQARAREIQKRSEQNTKKSIYEQELDKHDDIVDQIANCKIYAPQDGLVVYFVSDQSRWGSGSQQSIVAQGEPVKEGQRLMRIPDLRHMLVNTKVHEAMVSRVDGDVWRSTGLSDSIRAALLFNVSPFSRWFAQVAITSPDVRAHLKGDDNHPIKDQELVRSGQRASIRIDAVPGKTLPGHVKSIATVASQQDWMSTDVKVYQTLVSIDQSLDGLKPGMSAEVTIHIEDSGSPVLTVPLQAIVGGAEMGKTRKVWVRTPDGPVEKDILVGLANEKMAEVREGLTAGDEVVLNPRALVGDRQKTRSANEADAPHDGPGGEEKKGKGRGKAGMGKSGFDKSGMGKSGPGGPPAPAGGGVAPSGKAA